MCSSFHFLSCAKTKSKKKYSIQNQKIARWWQPSTPWYVSESERIWSMRILYCLATLSLAAGLLSAQQYQPAATDGKLRIIVFGAHPDDCEVTTGGVTAKYAKLGHHVKFVALTTGDNGHPTMGGGALAAR